MPQELISPAAAGIGAASYLGAKLFEPMLKQLGESVRDYLNERVRRIFLRAEELAEGVELGPPLRPGFVALFIQQSSFADENEDLTDRWARLLLDAARSYSNKHANFVDILAQLGPVEVLSLDALVRGHDLSDYDDARLGHFSLRICLEELLSDFDPKADDKDQCTIINAAELPWPARWQNSFVRGTSGQSYNMGMAEHHTELSPHGRVTLWEPLAVDILARQRLVEDVVFEVTGENHRSSVNMLVMTALGVDFVRVCRGKHDDGDSD